MYLHDILYMCGALNDSQWKCAVVFVNSTKFSDHGQHYLSISKAYTCMSYHAVKADLYQLW